MCFLLCCRGSFPYFYGLLSAFHIINESSTLENLHIIDGLKRSTDLDVFAELLVEFDIFLGIFRNVGDHINTLLYKIFTDYFQDFVLLK